LIAVLLSVIEQAQTVSSASISIAHLLPEELSDYLTIVFAVQKLALSRYCQGQSPPGV
jgi:Mg2+/citrate symporter